MLFYTPNLKNDRLSEIVMNFLANSGGLHIGVIQSLTTIIRSPCTFSHETFLVKDVFNVFHNTVHVIFFKKNYETF